MNKDKIIELVTQDMRASGVDNIERRCLHWSALAIRRLREHGCNAIIQAGSAEWMCLEPDWMVGYHWEPDHPASLVAMLTCGIPELHAWVADVDAQEIIDFTTPFVPIITAQMGFDWGFGEDPIPVLWGGEEEVKKVRGYYRPSGQATGFVRALINDRPEEFFGVTV